jgi:hypothetical protein
MKTSLPCDHLDNTSTSSSSVTLSAIVASLFAVKMRDLLDSATSGDKSDAAFTWGM